MAIKSNNPKKWDSTKVEKPLSPSETIAILVSATAVMALFYIFALISLTFIAFIIIIDFIFLLGAARFGLATLLVKPLEAIIYLAALILRSLNIKKPQDFTIELNRNDAPRFFDLVENIARRVGVDIPRTILLSSGWTAWVNLHGYRKGIGGCVLGIGYDLFVTLNEAELQSVIAHEMAHSKLIERGYRNWLGNAVTRIAILAGELNALNSQVKESRKRFFTAELLGKAVNIYARVGTRLMAAYSRQHEFAADRIAAEIAGFNAFKNALITANISDYKGRGLTWRDYVIQTQRGSGFADWLASKLTPESDQERDEIIQKIHNVSERYEYSTHPILADRLAAISDDDSTPVSSEPALGLLQNPDDIAARLIAHIEKVASVEQRKDSIQLRRQIRKQAGSTKYISGQFIAVLLYMISFSFICAGFALIFIPEMRSGLLPWITLIFGLSAGVGAFHIWRRYRHPERIRLPIPNAETWEKALESKDRKADITTWYEGIESELLSKISADIKGKRARERYWADKCYLALSVCDYRKALVASRLCLQTKKSSLEGLIGNSIAAAYFGQSDEAYASINKAFTTFSLGYSVSWGLGWATALMNDWGYSEGFMLDAAACWPNDAGLAAILSVCQWQRGKYSEALENIRRAVKIRPQENYYRIHLFRMLVAVGRIREAQKELELLQRICPDEFELILGIVRLNLALNKLDAAAEHAARLEQLYPNKNTFIRLARIYSEADQDDMTTHYCNEALKTGFYPEALVSLAHIEYKRKDYEKARAFLRNALDFTRELPEDAESPLNMLTTICQGLLALGEPIRGCKCYQVKIELNDSPTKAKSLSLLIVALTKENAEEQARWIHSAIHPNQDSHNLQISCEEAGDEDQPQGPAVPGIYGYKFE